MDIEALPDYVQDIMKTHNLTVSDLVPIQNVIDNLGSGTGGDYCRFSDEDMEKLEAVLKTRWVCDLFYNRVLSILREMEVAK